MQDYRKLEAWKQGHELTLEVYRITGRFTKGEIDDLITEMRRTCVYIPAKIAGGCGAGGNSALLRYLLKASAYASQLDYYLLLTHQLGYLATDDHNLLLDGLKSVRRSLNGLLQRLSAGSKR